MEIIIILAVIVVVVIWFISAQRKLVTLDENVNNAMSQIGVQLSSRFDALTALVDITKEYDEHEYKTLTDVIGMRKTINGNSSAKQAKEQENIITEAMTHIMAVAENYPDLKANENYLKLMDSTNEYENFVRKSRLVYNDTVTKLNREIRMFPTSIAASLMKIDKREYLEEDDKKADMPNMRRG